MSELVGLNVQTPNFMQTMSSLMGLRQQQQQLQAGAADLQMTQQDAAQRKALANIDLSKYMDGGVLDLNGIAQDPDIRKAAGDYYPQYLASLSQAQSAQTASKAAMKTLTDDQRKTFAEMLNPLTADKDVKAGNAAGVQKVKNAYNQFAQTYGIDAAKAVAPTALPLMNNQIPPNRLGDMIAHVRDQALSLDQQRPSGPMIQGRNGVQMQNTNAYAPGGIAEPVKQGIAPQLATAGTGQSVVIGNNATSMTPVGSTGQHGQYGRRTAEDDAPPPNAPAAVQESYHNAVAAANDHAIQTRTADAGYKTNVDISNKIRELSQETRTGPLSSKIQELTGQSNYQELGAYLDRQAASLQTAMGLPHTNAGVETAQQISGNAKYSPKAIQEKNDFNQSLIEGLHAYRQGLDRVAGYGGNASPVAVDQFKAAWADAFDPNVYRAKSAYERGVDQGKAFIKTLSANEAKKMLEDKKKLDLLTKGIIPQ